MRKMVNSITENNEAVKGDATPEQRASDCPLLDSSTNTLKNSSDRIGDNSTMEDEVEDTESDNNQDDGKVASERIDDKSNDDVYEVQEIIDHKYIRKAKYFLIRWKDYTEADDTWELESALSCPELIAEYLKTHPDKKQPSSDKLQSSALKKTPPANRQSSVLKKTSPPKRQRSAWKKTPPANRQSSALKKTPPANRQSSALRQRSTTPFRITKHRDSVTLTKRRSRETKVSEAQSQSVYEVDKIIDHKLQNCQMLFRIRWKGYEAKDDTWEPESDLKMPIALNEYLSNIKGSTEEEADKGRQVMKIIGEKIIKRKRYFLVQWKDCDESESTWEEVNSIDCDDQIENFRKLRRPSSVAADKVTRKRRSDAAASPKMQDTPKIKRGTI